MESAFLLFNSCTFLDNTADFGGGIHVSLLSVAGTCCYHRHTSFIIEDPESVISLTSRSIFTNGQSTIVNNTTPLNGGGMYLDGQSYISTANGGHVTFAGNVCS